MNRTVVEASSPLEMEFMAAASQAEFRIPPQSNISFDSQGNPLSVNAGFLEACTPQTAGMKSFPCTLGPSQLKGTGFEGHAATGWLQTSAPIENPGENITLDFAVWDSSDGNLDTTGLFDNFRFEIEKTPTVTKPADDPS